MSKRVLIVDDSSVIRASVRFTLEEAGFEVADAVNGKNGLEVLKGLVQSDSRPDLIITDINMPIMDGITFIKYVKKSSAKFVPILVLTTESQGSMKMEGKKAGAAGWLVKPFKDDQLIKVVNKLVM